MSERDDDLVYVPGLGWIDPEDMLGSLGVVRQPSGDWWHYTLPDGRSLWVPKKAEWELLRVIIDDAESESKQT